MSKQRTGPPDKLITPSVFSDQPEKGEAHFHFDEFADTLARLIADRNTGTPLVLGVDGPWGSGKTTLLKRLQDRLDEGATYLDNPSKQPAPNYINIEDRGKQALEKHRICRTVFFNAWKYSTEEQVMAALLREIILSMRRSDFWTKLRSHLDDPESDKQHWVSALFKNIAKIPGAGLMDLDLEAFRSDTPASDALAFYDHFRSYLRRLLSSWVDGKVISRKPIDDKRGVLVVFIDDLDRCLPEKTVQVLESVKLFLDEPGCVFVLGADLNVIQGAVAKHYVDMPVISARAEDYLDKLIQLRFALPRIAETGMNEFLTGKVAEDHVDPDMLEARELLMAGTELNPRKIKMAINDINLKWAMLLNTGQAKATNRSDFIKWGILESIASKAFFDQLREHPDPLGFLTEARLWAAGDLADETKKGLLDAAYGSRHQLKLKKLLKKLEFSDGFDNDTIAAFLSLEAPPQREEPTATPVSRGKVHQVDEQLIADTVLVKIPEGSFLMGSKEGNSQAQDDEMPQADINLDHDYWIGRFPVTNAQFHRFITAEQGYDYAGELPDGKDEHPVVKVSWGDALAYCRWLSASARKEIDAISPGAVFTLPSEAEWEKAARGPYGREWPWGDSFDAGLCNSGESSGRDTTAVGDFSPGGDSVYGAADMAGNVFEWTRSVWRDYPFDPKHDPVSDLDPQSDHIRSIRGGAFDDGAVDARCAFRSWLHPRIRSNVVGFRVVLSP